MEWAASIGTHAQGDHAHLNIDGVRVFNEALIDLLPEYLRRTKSAE